MFNHSDNNLSWRAWGQARGIFKRAAVVVAASVKLHGARPMHL